MLHERFQERFKSFVIESKWGPSVPKPYRVPTSTHSSISNGLIYSVGKFKVFRMSTNLLSALT